MHNSDYIISVDENGTPYIAHAIDGHRYLQKIITNGKTRYFYTRDQIEAYIRRLRGQRLIRRRAKNREAGLEVNWQTNRPTSHQKTITGSAKVGWSNRRTYN